MEPSKRNLGPLDVGPCDAPPYLIVVACGVPGVGMDRPEDRPWVPRGGEHYATCCSGPRTLQAFTFTYAGGREEEYFLAQCPRCKTIFWSL